MYVRTCSGNVLCQLKISIDPNGKSLIPLMTSQFLVNLNPVTHFCLFVCFAGSLNHCMSSNDGTGNFDLVSALGQMTNRYLSTFSFS